MRQVVVVMVVTISAVLISLLYLKRDNQGMLTQTDTSIITPQILMEAPVSNDDQKKQLTHIKSGKSELPDIDHLRRDVENNPHVTSEILISFARKMAPKIEQAMKSKDFAAGIFDELLDCIHSRKKTAVAVQAFCLSNAREISKKYPSEFSHQYNRLLDQVSSESIELTNAIEAAVR